MKVPAGFVVFLVSSLYMAVAQPYGLSNRVANTTLRMPLGPTPITNFNYRIPPDNPYVGATSFNGIPVNSNNVRTEFYAVGLRNPWRWSFDRLTGLLWLADVGQGAREEVNIIHKGGNYGWNYREGTIAGPEAPPPGFTHINPIQDYGRGNATNQGASVTGGVVYRGSRMPELQGAYIFADYVSGNIWQMRYEESGGVTNITPFSWLMNEGEIVCFGTDPSNGDVLMGDLNNAQIRRLLNNPYRVVNAFGALSFTGPMAIVTPPGETNRVFIVEQAGRISVITNLTSPTRTVFMDIAGRVRAGGEQGLLGMAFHPGYTTNHYFYVFYTSNTNGNQTGGGDNTRHDILSRFQISATNTNAGDTNSEVVLISQRDEESNHNGGDLHFGADGYLYLSLGDEGAANDSRDNSQNITKDFFAGMIRIDVDFRPDSLMPNPHPANQIIHLVTNIPPTLAETGAFEDLATLTPQEGIIPYDVNVSYWTDGAIKTRWFCITNPALDITYRTSNPWTFPLGTVFIQHFDLEMTNGVPESRRRIETRFLVRDTSSANQGVYGVTYRWDSPTNATLVSAAGEQEVLEINDGGVPRLQTWRYPSRAQCAECHNTQAGRALGFNAPQLNRDFDYDGIVDNQIRALNNAGYFNSAVSNIHAAPLMADLGDTSSGLMFRMRSYFMANCAHCHYLPRAPAIGMFDARIYRLLTAQGILEGNLVNTLGNPSNRVVSAGSEDRSIAYQRMASETANFRMPPLDSSVPHQTALSAFREWIAELTNYQTFPVWQTNHFGATNTPSALAAADPDSDGARNHLEYLTDTDPNAAADFWTIGIQRSGPTVSVVFTQAPNRGFEVQWSTNLNSTSSWRFLDIPQNRPNYPGQTEVRTVPDSIDSEGMKFYRVRPFEQ